MQDFVSHAWHGLNSRALRERKVLNMTNKYHQLCQLEDLWQVLLPERGFS
jgi:hypothetical protein